MGSNYTRNATKRRNRAQLNEELRRLRKNPDDVMTAERIMAMPAGPDKAEVMAFARFLSHHAAPTKERGSAICTCGVPALLMIPVAVDLNEIIQIALNPQWQAIQVLASLLPGK